MASGKMLSLEPLSK